MLGPLIADLAGLTLTAEERERLAHPLIGGVILFSRNYQNPAQLAALVADLHGLREPPLLVCVDHEGGRVQRFRAGFSELPALAQLGKRYDHNPGAAHKLAAEHGWLMAAELRALGVDLSFAPVLDLDYGACSVIGDRAFHRSPHVVAELALAYLGGMHQAGMAATGKHFPGHGAVVEDSHLTLPVDRRSLDEIRVDDLIPYEHLIPAGLAAIMPAHVIYERVDARPAGFSPFWIREVLRRQLGFEGAVFSDDLHMAAAGWAGGYVARAEAAFEAGCDLILVCNDPAGVVELLDGLHTRPDAASGLRRARLRGHPGPADSLAALHQQPRWHSAVNALARLAESPEMDLELGN
jgi:beta-N-acetylhexosaminidase